MRLITIFVILVAFLLTGCGESMQRGRDSMGRWYFQEHAYQNNKDGFLFTEDGQFYVFRKSF
jgi:hypothetical protein